MKILFTTRLPEEGFTRISGETIDIPATPYYSEDELIERIADAEVLVSTFDYKVSRRVIEAANRLRLVANFGVGFNNIDLIACSEKGILVTNTPLPVIEPTAELAFALMHTIARKTALFDRQLRCGAAEPFGVMNNLSNTLYGKTLGIIGMGRIGQALARRAVASGMKIIYHNRHRLLPEIEQQYRAEFVSQEELLRISDFVSLNLPYTPEVRHLIGQPELSIMKPTAYLINTARGAHIDENALVEALSNHTIAGAALDVYEFEPKISEALLSLDNVVLSPHTGTGTWEGRIAMCENVADNILKWKVGNTAEMDIVR